MGRVQSGLKGEGNEEIYRMKKQQVLGVGVLACLFGGTVPATSFAGPKSFGIRPQRLKEQGLKKESLSIKILKKCL